MNHSYNKRAGWLLWGIGPDASQLVLLKLVVVVVVFFLRFPNCCKSNKIYQLHYQSIEILKDFVTSKFVVVMRNK